MQTGEPADSNERSDTCAVPVVATSGLTKIFRDFWRRPRITAVDELDLEIRGGEVFGLLGPNGSGKSTTIKLILGLLHPTAGRVSVWGRPPYDVGTKRDIGYLPEESYLYSYLTARETLNFFADMFGLDRATRRERVGQLLEMAGLTHAADRRVGEFSKGMARRVSLAQALINDPKLVILDEPTSGLDPVGCRQVKDLILALARRGRTIVLSSHLLADMEDVCDRVAVLYSGRVRARGRIRSLLEEHDRVRMTVPALPPERMREVLAWLKKKVGSDPAVDHPARNLEQFFLEVVSEAHRDGGSTSGVAASDGLAEYLTHE